MIFRSLIFPLLLIVACWSSGACAHEVNPALLHIVEGPDQSFDVLLKRPINGNRILALQAEINGKLLKAADAHRTVGPLTESLAWQQITVDGQIRDIRVAGLETTITDVLVLVEPGNGDVVQRILTPQNPRFELESNNPLEHISGYLTLGVKHILTGFDHLLFVLGLILLLRGFWPLLGVITAFTIAHSITLALITLGHVKPDVPLIETLVALSIVFVAVEVARAYRGFSGLMLHCPWILAFVFGLLHGSAFGGELIHIGLPEENLLSSLLLFNLGIEIGQLVFLAIVFGLYLAFRKVPVNLPAGINRMPPYAIGSLGALWFFERLGSSLTLITGG